MARLRYVDFCPKICLILYPTLGNLITQITIMPGSKADLRKLVCTTKMKTVRSNPFKMKLPHPCFSAKTSTTFQRWNNFLSASLSNWVDICSYKNLQISCSEHQTTKQLILISPIFSWTFLIFSSWKRQQTCLVKKYFLSVLDQWNFCFHKLRKIRGNNWEKQDWWFDVTNKIYMLSLSQCDVFINIIQHAITNSFLLLVIPFMI